MKTAEKRHELQKNELADWLGHQIEDVRPHFVPIVVISLAIVAVIVGAFVYYSGETSASAAAWNAYFSAFAEREPDAALKKVIETQQGNSAALWAKQSLADMNLAQGAGQLFRDRKQAEEKLALAERNYKEILETGTEAMLLTRARYGLARVYESQCKPEEARKMYEMVVKSEGENALGQAASKNVKRLSDESDIELLRWFAKQVPKIPPPTGNPFGNPNSPLNDLPSRPDISIPPGLGLGTPGETKIGETPVTDAIGDKPLIELKPEERKSVEPAPDAKPADAKPVEGAK